MAVVNDYNTAYVVMQDVAKNGLDVGQTDIVNRLDSLANALWIVTDYTGYQDTIRDLIQRTNAARITLESIYTLSGDLVASPTNSRFWNEEKWERWLDTYLSVDNNPILRNAQKIVHPIITAVQQISTRLPSPDEGPPTDYRNDYDLTGGYY